MSQDTLIPPAVPIVLKGILLEDTGELFVVFSAGDAERIVSTRPEDIVLFDRFRRHLVRTLDLRVVYRRGNWYGDVVAAAVRGGVLFDEGEADVCCWLNQDWVTAVEAAS